MKANTLRAALLSAILAISACADAAAPAPSQPPPQLSMTRPMTVFSGLERELAAAIASHDKAATDRLLSQDFEFRPGTHPGEPTARTDWAADPTMQGGGTDQLSVREFDSVAVVSFVMASAEGASSYVVDVWKKQGGDWQLLTRYQAELPGTEPATEDVTPTGKG